MSKASFYNIAFLVFLWLIFPACNATSQVANTAEEMPQLDPTRFAPEIDKINKIRFDNSTERIVFTGSSSIRFWLDVQERYPIGWMYKSVTLRIK